MSFAVTSTWFWCFSLLVALTAVHGLMVPTNDAAIEKSRFRLQTDPKSDFRYDIEKSLEDFQRKWPPGHPMLSAWPAHDVKQVNAIRNGTLEPSVATFQALVNSDSSLKKLAADMFTEIPNLPPYNETPTGLPQVRDFDHMIEAINSIIKQGPQFFDRQSPSTAMGLLGVPLNAILNWPTGTRSGYAFFQNPDVNRAFRDILNTWAKFLASIESQQCLIQPGGWLSEDALSILSKKAQPGAVSSDFSQIYECDPSQPNYGFTSWDDFFTRKFHPGVRPVTPADNAPSTPKFPSPGAVILNSCESTPLRYATNVQWHDTFWLKGQPYSLAHMLNHGPYTADFIGGSVYQAFLSAESYHRWHAPVSGTVVRVENVPGTYYATNMYEGFENENGGADPNAPNLSQPFASAVATRALIYIRADNPDIGLMVGSYIGMAEVSSCEITVQPGDRVEKGDELGLFHYGGSTYALIFRPETKLKFLTEPSTWGRQMDNNAVNDALAVVETTDRGSSRSTELDYEIE